jgi:hypothetical protein
MKTTIDLPAPLSKGAQLRAAERGITLKEMMIGASSDSLEIPATAGKNARPHGARPPETAVRVRGRPPEGRLPPVRQRREVTDLISDDRDDR